MIEKKRERRRGRERERERERERDREREREREIWNRCCGEKRKSVYRGEANQSKTVRGHERL